MLELSTGPFGRIPKPLEFFNEGVAVFSLNLDHAVLDRAACAADPFELSAKLQQLRWR